MLSMSKTLMPDAYDVVHNTHVTTKSWKHYDY